MLPFFSKSIFTGALGGQGGTESETTVLTSVNCMGNESTLLSCETMNSTNCISKEIATVICQGQEMYHIIDEINNNI